MTAARATRRDQVGLVALLLPVAGLLLYIAAALLAPSGVHTAATALMLASFVVVFGSVPYAGVVAIRSRRTDRRRMRRAVFGLLIGLGLSLLFICGTWLVHARAKAAQEQLRIEAEQAAGGRP